MCKKPVRLVWWWWFYVNTHGINLTQQRKNARPCVFGAIEWPVLHTRAVIAAICGRDYHNNVISQSIASNNIL